MSAKLRLALWVTTMVLLLSAMVLAMVLIINRHSLPEDPAEYLVDVVIDNANDVEFDRGTFEWDDLTVYKRGVYCSFYNSKGELLLSANKEDMDFSKEEFRENTIRTVSSGGREYYLYDKYVDMEVSGLWIRGVVPTDSRFGIMDTIVTITVSVLPVILVITFLGALLISSGTFRPIRKIVDTANSISDADDLTDLVHGGRPDGRQLDDPRLCGEQRKRGDRALLRRFYGVRRPDPRRGAADRRGKPLRPLLLGHGGGDPARKRG